MNKYTYIYSKTSQKTQTDEKKASFHQQNPFYNGRKHPLEETFSGLEYPAIPTLYGISLDIFEDAFSPTIQQSH